MEVAEVMRRYLELSRKYPWILAEKFGDGKPSRKLDPSTFVETVLRMPALSDGWVTIGTRRNGREILNGTLSTHGIVGLRAALGSQTAKEHCETWCDAAVTFCCDLVQWHTVLGEEEANYLYHRRKLTLSTQDSDGTDVLIWGGPPARPHYGLEELPWLTVFGPAYVAFFGRDRLLNAPAEVVDEVAPGYIAVQLTREHADIGAYWSRFNAKRQAVMDYLGRDVFQRPRRPEESRLNERHPLNFPASRVPEKYLKDREEADRKAEKQPTEQGTPSPKPLPISNLNEMLADVARFRVDWIDDFVIVDKRRKEMIAVPENKLLSDWIASLIAAGAETTAEAEAMYEKTIQKPRRK